MFDMYIGVDLIPRLYLKLKLSPLIVLLQFIFCNLTDWKDIRLKGIVVSNLTRE